MHHGAFAQAQATVNPDGQFRYALGAGASYASGNTNSSSLNITGGGVRATADSKWRFRRWALGGQREGATTAESLALGTQYDRDISADWLGFGKADCLRDKLANLSSRMSLYGDAGYHVFKSEPLTWGLSAGLGYAQDRYFNPAEVNGQLRTRDGRAEVLLAEESTHKRTPTTSFHQQLTVYPALSSGGGYPRVRASRVRRRGKP